MQRATIVTTPSNELGLSIQGSAPFLIVRTPTVEGKYSCTSNKNPRVGPGNNAGCLDCPNSSTICPESEEGLPSYPLFTDVGFFDGARLLIAKISHHSDTCRGGKYSFMSNKKKKKPPGRTGKQHQVSQLLEFVYHLP